MKDSMSAQKRAVYITAKLYQGEELTSRKLQDDFKVYHGVDVSLRQIQRDLRAIADIVMLAEFKKTGKQTIWCLNKDMKQYW